LLYVKYWDPGVFRASPRPPIARRPSTPALTAVQRQVSGVRACSPWPLDLPALPGFVRSSTRPTGVGRCSAGPRLLRFRVPLAASLLRSGLPGITTPGTFRPWPFSSLRRIAPSDSSPVLFHTGTTSGIQRARTIRRLPCGPDRSILGTVPPGIAKPGHAETRKSLHTAPMRCMQQCLPSTEAFLPCSASAHHSPSRLQATDPTSGRADLPGIPAPNACRPPAHIVCVSLTAAIASNRFGRRARRHARSCRQAASAGHHRPLQRHHCPNDNTTPLKKQAAIVRCQPSHAPRCAAKRPFGSSSRPSLQADERSVLQYLLCKQGTTDSP
jgi:hypothetical protein